MGMESKQSNVSCIVVVTFRGDIHLLYKPRYVKYVKCKYESDMDIAVQGTTSL